MLKLIYIMGKSSSGKDTVKNLLIDELNKKDSSVSELVLYTTREIRINEVDGEDYHFVDELQYQEMEKEGVVVEARTYNKVQGPVRYFTVFDKEKINLSNDYMVTIGTLESFEKIKKYISNRNKSEFDIVPIYLEVDGVDRLSRAIEREKLEDKNNQNFKEVHRRYEADEIDFSEDNLKRNCITKRFKNITIENTIKDIIRHISELDN